MITFTITNKSRPKATVIMIVSYAGRQYRVSCGVGLPPKMWSDKKHRAKVTADFDGSGINDTLDRYESAAKSYIRKCTETWTVPTQEEFRDFVAKTVKGRVNEGGNKDTKNLVTYIEEIYLPRYTPVRSELTIRGFRTALGFLKEYEGLYGKVALGNVDISFYNSFKSWFFEPRNGRTYTLNYFGKMVKFIKQVVREAKTVDRLHDSDGIDHRNFIKCQEHGAAIYLTIEELKAVEECELPSDALKKARDIFLIGCYTGLRISDLSRLTDENFDGRFIRLRTVKTKDSLVIPIHPVVRRIMDDGFDFTEKIYEQKVNERIKEVCRLAGIVQEVTTYRTQGDRTVSTTKPKCDFVTCHTARRSFATNAYKMGVPTIAIMKITGHRQESTFMRYIKITEEENAEIVAKSAFFDPFGTTKSETNFINY